MSLTAAVGLHITKCAGTSLISTLRKRMSEDEYQFSSSYYENFIANRPLLSEMLNVGGVRIVFGHFVNELIFRLIPDRPIYLFTGLREPLSRARSHFQQICAVQSISGQPLITAEEYLETNQDSMCREIMRCFPSLERQLATEPLWERARKALSLFNFVYSSEHFERDARVLLQTIDLEITSFLYDNISSRKQLSPQANDHIVRSFPIIEANASIYFAADVKLYAAMLPYLGAEDFRARVVNEPWAIWREGFVNALPAREEALNQLRKLEHGYMAYEFSILGKLDLLRDALQSRIVGNTELLALVNSYSTSKRPGT